MPTSPARVATHCDLCGQDDTHPKHHESRVGRVESHHHDCGADGGCDVCVTVEATTGGVRHDDLSALVTTPDHVRAVADRLGAALPEED